jgi:hypothetical protein
MNGAIADPWLRTINPPNNPMTINIGKSQYFFLTIRNLDSSIIKLMAIEHSS